MAINRGDTYQNTGDKRVYEVVAAGKDVVTGRVMVAFKQIVNALDEDAIADGEVKLGKKSYFRDKDSFLAKYVKVEFEDPAVARWVKVD
jgi:hypothetical protein